MRMTERMDGSWGIFTDTPRADDATRLNLVAVMPTTASAAAVVDAWAQDQAASDAAYLETLKRNRMPLHGSGCECGLRPALVLGLLGRLI